MISAQFRIVKPTVILKVVPRIELKIEGKETIN